MITLFCLKMHVLIISLWVAELIYLTIYNFVYFFKVEHNHYYVVFLAFFIMIDTDYDVVDIDYFVVDIDCYVSIDYYVL